MTSNEEKRQITTIPLNKDTDFDQTKLVEKLKKHIFYKLDYLPFSSFHVWIIASLGIFWILDGFEASLLSVLSGVLKTIFLMKDSEVGLCGSLYLIGCTVGSLIFGFLSSKWGRKVLFTVTLIIYSLSITATAFAVNKYMFFVCRFFTGVSVGGEYSSIFAAIDELIPPSIRGRVDIITDGTWHLGSSIAAISSYILLDSVEGGGQEVAIRILFIVGVIFALPVIYLRRNVPESPRWLLSRGQYTTALNVVTKIEQKCLMSRRSNQNNNDYFNTNNYSEDNESNKLLSYGVDTFKYIKNENLKGINVSDILKKLFIQHRIKFFYALILMASQAFFYNGIFYTYALVLEDFYEIKKEKCGIYLIPLSVASFLGPLVIAKYFDSWSRRKMIALTYNLTGLLLILTALNFITNTFSFVFQQIFWFITFFVASPAASSAHLTVSEIFPISMRSQAMAIFFSCGLGIGGVCAPYIYGIMIQNKDKTTIFYSYLLAAFVMIAAGIFGFFFGVNAENKSLEEISKETEAENTEYIENTQSTLHQ